MRASAFAFVVLAACGSSHTPGGGSGSGAPGSAGLAGSATPQDPCVAISEPCTDARGPSFDKFIKSDEQRWQAESGAHDVVILLNHSAPATCSQMQRQAVHEASQACVKQLILRLNGSVVEDSTSWFINVFEARLNWEQIQRVAEHPQVQSIQNRQTDTPPPGATPRD